jgi:hypothetical protein
LYRRLSIIRLARGISFGRHSHGLSVRRHVPSLNGEYSLIVYYQDNNIQFKQTIHYINRKTIRNTMPNAKTYRTLLNHYCEHCFCSLRIYISVPGDVFETAKRMSCSAFSLFLALDSRTKVVTTGTKTWIFQFTILALHEIISRTPWSGILIFYSFRFFSALGLFQ